MKILEDQWLVDAYKNSVQLQLEQEFIALLLTEIKNRNLEFKIQRYQQHENDRPDAM